LIEGPWTFGAQAAALAFVSAPDPIEKLLHVVQEKRVVGDDSYLEVSASAALGAETGTGPVRTAEVKKTSVDDDRFHVDARAESHFEVERRVLLELFAKRARGR